MKAMIKFESQFDAVDKVMSFAQARSGKISAPSNHGQGPYLEITCDIRYLTSKEDGQDRTELT